MGGPALLRAGRRRGLRLPADALSSSSRIAQEETFLSAGQEVVGGADKCAPRGYERRVPSVAPAKSLDPGVGRRDPHVPSWEGGGRWIPGLKDLAWAAA